MPQWESVAIVGVGLIGGSLGLALRTKKLARQVIGIARRASSAQRALSAGVVDQCVEDVAEGVARAQFVVACTPVESIVATIERLAPCTPPGVIITDAGSTKKQIVAALSRTRLKRTFVGSHPMAGSEKTGPEHADAELFRGRTVVLTPTPSTPEAARAQLTSFWESVGATVVVTTAAKHDAAVAATSHVPHLLASVLAAGTPVPQLEQFIGTGWLDSTRIAAGDPEIWRQIVSQNRDPIIKRLLDLESRLAACRQAIVDEDDHKLTRILTAGKRNRDTLGS